MIVSSTRGESTEGRNVMKETPLALLVGEGPQRSLGLKDKLESFGVSVCAVSDCAEAALLLHSYTPPHIVFTDMQLPDGSWSGTLSLAESARLPVCVVVVSRIADMVSYIQALERGAFDYIVPPFEVSEIDHIIRCALGNVRLRRQLHRTMAMEASLMNEETCGFEDDLEVASSL